LDVARLLAPKKGDVFFDVGTHIGKYNCIVAKMVWEEGLVVAVEPNPANFAVLV
jgi:FkbM family methyltransferase